MANELMNVEAFANARPAAAFVQQPFQESLADGIGASYGVLSYRGKSWSLRYRGESHMLLRPDDGTPMGYIDLIIVKQARTKSKSYYAPGTYDAANPSNERPLCSSLDGITPDHDARAKQAQACAICPHNEFKQLPDGKKRRDCSDYKRLAVLLMPAAAKLMLNGETLSEPVFLRVPPASLNDLASYGTMLESKGFPFFAVVTRIKFDAAEAHPKFIFTAQRPLTDEDARFIMPLRDDPQTTRIIGEGGPFTRGAAQTVLGAPQSNVVQLSSASAGIAGAGNKVIEGEIMAPSPPPPPPPAPPKEFELDDGSSVMSALKAAPAAAPVAASGSGTGGAKQTLEDTSSFPVAADPALEDKIAALLKTN